MSKSNKFSPVLLIIFNRPDTTSRVFERIREAQPRQLYIAADGPRSNVPADVDLCNKTRQIAELVDWDCEVHRLFRDSNLGCKKGVSSAIDWFFDHVDSGIILEDDCLADISFFRYCTELLEYYKSDERIGIISGDLFVDTSDIAESYYFSNFSHTWGWATWRRVWKKFDLNMKTWPKDRETDLVLRKTHDKYYAEKWKNIFQNTYMGKFDTWDYQVVYMLWKQNQLSISPKVNLVSNIGFGPQSTHTRDSNSKFSCIPAKEISFPLSHPKSVYSNIEKDRYDLINSFGPIPSRFSPIINRIKKYLGCILN